MLSPNFSIPLHSTEIFLCNTWIFCRFVCLFDDRIIICRLLFINLDLAWCLLESKLLLARIYLYIYIVFRKICNIVECSICSFDVQFNTDLIRGLSTHKKKKTLTLTTDSALYRGQTLGEREREKNTNCINSYHDFEHLLSSCVHAWYVYYMLLHFFLLYSSTPFSNTSKCGLWA